MIGKLKPIKLIQYSNTTDANGDATETVATTYKMWAEISDDGGGRTQQDGKSELSDTKTFKIFFRGYNITPDFQIVYFGQTYSISNAKRINEQRFNWELTGFAIFELTANATPGPIVIPPTFEYNQELGILTFIGGYIGNNRINANVTNLQGGPYYNHFNEANALIPVFDREGLYPYLTPPDEVIVYWNVGMNVPPYTILTETLQTNLTCERLPIRTFRIYTYNVQNSVLSYTVIQNGSNVYNCIGDNIGYAVGIDEYISIQNADAVNSQYFEITGYILQTVSQFGPNYLLTVAPKSPFQQYNPANTILYLQGG